MNEIGTQAEQRAEIVAALNGLAATVDGKTVTLTASATAPPTITAYSTWPEWIATRPTGMCAWEIDWYLLVALPGADTQTYVASGDELSDAVMAALGAWDVTRIEPVLIAVSEAASVPALRFSFTI